MHRYTHRNARLYCASFKPVIMWRAMVDGSQGDFVMWEAAMLRVLIGILDVCDASLRPSNLRPDA